MWLSLQTDDPFAIKLAILQIWLPIQQILSKINLFLNKILQK